MNLISQIDKIKEKISGKITFNESVLDVSEIDKEELPVTTMD